MNYPYFAGIDYTYFLHAMDDAVCDVEQFKVCINGISTNDNFLTSKIKAN